LLGGCAASSFAALAALQVYCFHSRHVIATTKPLHGLQKNEKSGQSSKKTPADFID
jgi:hypothetical protein